MKIVLYTHTDFKNDPLFCFLYRNIKFHFQETYIISVDPGETFKSKIRRLLKKIKRLGPLYGLEIILTLPLSRYFFRKDQKKFKEILDNEANKLPRDFSFDHIQETVGVNSSSSEKALADLAPDFIIQAGAGLLRKNIFSIAKKGTINLHHGIAPLIRGMDSAYWAKWYDQNEWLGVTVHYIDQGIDTGRPIYYAQMKEHADKDVGTINAMATIEATKGLVAFFQSQLEKRPYDFPLPKEYGLYKSTISGWKILRSR